MLSDYRKYLLRIRNNLIQCGVEFPVEKVVSYRDVYKLGCELDDLLYYYSILAVAGSGDALEGFFLPLNGYYSEKVRSMTYREYAGFIKDYDKISVSGRLKSKIHLDKLRKELESSSKQFGNMVKLSEIEEVVGSSDYGCVVHGRYVEDEVSEAESSVAESMEAGREVEESQDRVESLEGIKYIKHGRYLEESPDMEESLEGIEYTEHGRYLEDAMEYAEHERYVDGPEEEEVDVSPYEEFQFSDDSEENFEEPEEEFEWDNEEESDGYFEEPEDEFEWGNEEESDGVEGSEEEFEWDDEESDGLEEPEDEFEWDNEDDSTEEEEPEEEFEWDNDDSDGVEEPEDEFEWDNEDDSEEPEEEFEWDNEDASGISEDAEDDFEWDNEDGSEEPADDEDDFEWDNEEESSSPEEDEDDFEWDNEDEKPASVSASKPTTVASNSVVSQPQEPRDLSDTLQDITNGVLTSLKRSFVKGVKKLEK